MYKKKPDLPGIIMKTTLLLGAFLWMLAPKPNIRAVSLTLQTRGVHKEIRVDARQMRITLNDRVATVPTPAPYWKQITGLLGSMSLPGLATLPASKSRQAVDAALAGQIQVVTSDRTFESVSYDHPNAPTALVPLVNALINKVPVGIRAEFK